MHPARGPTRTAPPHARFRCLVCQAFVVGTESGHCPKCGYVPPTAPQVAAELPRRPWRRELVATVWIGVAWILVYALGLTR